MLEDEELHQDAPLTTAVDDGHADVEDVSMGAPTPLPPPRREFLWWGLILHGSDFLIWMGLGISPPLLFVTLVISTKTLQGILVKFALAISFIGIFLGLLLWRSRQKHLRYHNSAVSFTSSSGYQPQRSFWYFVRHTLVELFILNVAVAITTFFDKALSLEEFEVSSLHMILIYTEILAGTAVFFRYYYRVQQISQSQIELHSMPSVANVALLTIHFVGGIGILQGLSTLWHVAWVTNPWSAILHMLEAFAGIGVVAKCTFVDRERPP